MKYRRKIDGKLLDLLRGDEADSESSKQAVFKDEKGEEHTLGWNEVEEAKDE